jgi:hypothetical protein
MIDSGLLACFFGRMKRRKGDFPGYLTASSQRRLTPGSSGRHPGVGGVACTPGRFLGHESTISRSPCDVGQRDVPWLAQIGANEMLSSIRIWYWMNTAFQPVILSLVAGGLRLVKSRSKGADFGTTFRASGNRATR